MNSFILFAGYIFCLYFMRLNGFDGIPVEYSSMIFEMSVVAVCVCWISPLLAIAALPIVGFMVGDGTIYSLVVHVSVGAAVALPSMILSTCFGVAFAFKLKHLHNISFDKQFAFSVMFPLAAIIKRPLPEDS